MSTCQPSQSCIKELSSLAGKTKKMWTVSGGGGVCGRTLLLCYFCEVLSGCCICGVGLAFTASVSTITGEM